MALILLYADSAASHMVLLPKLDSKKQCNAPLPLKSAKCCFAERRQCKATLASQMLSQLLTARSIAIIFVEQDGQQYGALFANLSLVTL